MILTLLGTCGFPACQRPAVAINRASQNTCATHYLVVVTGSWMDDKHGAEAHG
jgi:hypothetical protein